VAASSEVSVVAVEDVPSEVVQRETDIEMGKEDILKKPENIR
jgi:elongation factor Ts